MNNREGFATIAYDARTGAEVWMAFYEGPAIGNEAAVSVDVSPNGAYVYVAGYATYPGGPTGTTDDYTTIAYDATDGSLVWIATYDDPLGGLDYPYVLRVSPDGSTVYVTGACCSGLSGEHWYPDYGTVAYDAATGEELWTAEYAGPAGLDDQADALAVSGDGNSIYVTGYSAVDLFESEFTTIAYEADTGNQRWISRYQSPSVGLNQGFGITVSPDGGRVYATGSSERDFAGYDYLTLAYVAATGSIAWKATYGGSYSDYGGAIGVSPDGSRVLVTGSATIEANRYEFATLAYDAATGARIWRARYGEEGGSETASDLAVNPRGGRVYVTGSNASGNYITIAYRIDDGGLVWLEEYDETPSDHAYDLAVSPTGRHVFVTGASFGTDWLTVAYRS